MSYQFDESDLKKLQLQIDVDDKTGTRLLNLYQGNAVELICDFFSDNLKEEISPKEKEKQEEEFMKKKQEEYSKLVETEVDTKDKIKTIREILNAKDAIFKHKVGNEDDKLAPTMVKSYDYVSFSPKTTTYKKETFKGSRDFFLEHVVGFYLDSNVEYWNDQLKPKEEPVEQPAEQPAEEKPVEQVAEEKPAEQEQVAEKEQVAEEEPVEQEKKKIRETKVVIKKLTGKAAKMVKKWKFDKATILYLPPLLETNREDNINELGTRFILNCKKVDDKTLYGNAVVVNHRFD